MNRVPQFFTIFLSFVFTVSAATSFGSVKEITDQKMKDLQDAYNTVYGNRPGTITVGHSTAHGVTTIYSSVIVCKSDNTGCRQIHNDSFRVGNGNTKVDGKIYIAEVTDKYQNDRTRLETPTQTQPAPKALKRIHYVAGYSESGLKPGADSFQGSLQMSLNPSVSMPSEMSRYIPAVTSAVLDSYNDLNQALQTSKVMHEAYKNSLKSFSDFNKMLQVNQQASVDNTKSGESSLAVGLGLMSKGIALPQLSAEQMHDLNTLEQIKQDPLSFKQYELAGESEQQLLDGTQNAIQTGNLRELAVAAEIGMSQVDADKRKSFEKSFGAALKDGLIQVEKVNPRVGAGPLDKRSFGVPAHAPAGQALRKVGNMAQVYWSEQQGFQYATTQSKSAYLSSLVLLSSAEKHFLEGEHNEGYASLRIAHMLMQASVGFTKGLYNAGKDAVMSIPAMAEAAAALGRALIEDPSAVAEQAADLIIRTPEIAEAIGKAAIAYGQKFADGDLETRSEILGRIAGEVLVLYVTGGAAKVAAKSAQGFGTFVKIESQASRITEIVKPGTIIRQSLEGRTVAMQPQVVEAINAIQKIVPPGQDSLGKFDRIAAEFRKLEQLSINSLPEAIEHRKLVIQIRDGYNQEVSKIGEIAQASLNAGKSLEEVARECNSLRRSIGEKYKDMTPETLRKDIYGWNKNRYGDELGPSFSDFVNNGLKDGDSLTDIYVNIIKKSQRPNKHLNNLIEILKELP